ncbi:MAG TPA: long-chain fatty acid--CoA ligase [Bacteroidales bacterium]|nr:long-chain fatty acid--CoA ligase [Bacteroidales bacterium]
MLNINYIKEYIEKSIQENWDQPAFSDYQGKTFLYKDVAMQIDRIHKIFDVWEIKQGDKISLIGRNNSNWATTYLATISYGAVIVPILADFATDDIHHIVNHSDSVMLFVGDSIWDSLEEQSMPHLKAIFSIDSNNLIVSRDGKAERRYNDMIQTINEEQKVLTPSKILYPEISNDKLGVISYTSGTTGFSKGVMLSLNSLVANVDFGRNNIGLKPKNNVVSFLPLAHAYGAAFEFLMPFSIGCHITFLTKTPSPKIILQAFQEIKPRLVLAVPLIIEKIYKKQILPVLNRPAMKVFINIPFLNRKIYQKINKKLTDVFGGNFLEIVIGGAPLNKEVEDFLRKINFRYTIGYGMTECGPLISYIGWEKCRAGSCGVLLPTLEMKIDSNYPQQVAGEILLKGENVMEGYYKNEEATRKTIIDGWLHTGDLGVIDNDGYIYIKGRSKSLILGPSGQNIYPEEIEAKFNNLPFITESLIIEKQNKLIALVYPDLDAADEAKLVSADIEQIMEKHRIEVNKNLPSYSQVAKVRLYPEEFEKTPKKSIKRFLYQINEN